MNKQMKTFIFVGMIILLASGCGQLNSTSAPTPTQESMQVTGVVIESPAEPVMTPTTVTSDIVVPAGWLMVSHTVQSCEYSLNYPADMQFTDQGANSRFLSYVPADPNDIIWNFIYVSIISDELQTSSEEDIYNYNPMAAGLLLDLQIGESVPLHDNPQIASSYTYQRLPDRIISGQTAQAYENVQPWEFPVGTKEIRYYVSVNDCTYQIGGYLDTTQSNKPGTIVEDLFNQIIDGIHIK